MNLKPLIKRIRTVYKMRTPDFLQKYLNCEYKAFYFRFRKGYCYPNEVLYLSKLLDTPIENIFGMTYFEYTSRQGTRFVSEKLNNYSFLPQETEPTHTQDIPQEKLETPRPSPINTTQENTPPKDLFIDFFDYSR